MILLDAVDLEGRGLVNHRFHGLEIALRPQQCLCGRHGRPIQEGVVAARPRPVRAAECGLERAQMRAALAQELAQLAADQQIVRAQLALAAVEVVPAAVEQVRQQPLAGSTPDDRIDDDLQLHKPLRRPQPEPPHTVVKRNPEPKWLTHR